MCECPVVTASGLKSGRARDMHGPQGPLKMEKAIKNQNYWGGGPLGPIASAATFGK
jgi:hypothetical protein